MTSGKWMECPGGVVMVVARFRVGFVPSIVVGQHTEQPMILPLWGEGALVSYSTY
jgi:hypothetical protein